MTTEQDNKRVSDAYREVANEVTPAELDARILASAARDARSRYGLARAWVRPVAWAATIGLSLAFMLELTWFADAPPEVPAEKVAAPEDRARQDAEVMKAKQEDARTRAIARQAESQSLAAPASSGAEPKRASAELDQDAPATEEASLFRQAEQQARGQTESALSYAASKDRDHACDDRARATAESWYRCIRDLREQGLVGDAAAELEALLGVFPDFREPPPE
jgi:hypothetical protein